MTPPTSSNQTPLESLSKAEVRRLAQDSDKAIDLILRLQAQCFVLQADNDFLSGQRSKGNSVLVPADKLEEMQDRLATLKREQRFTVEEAFNRLNEMLTRIPLTEEEAVLSTYPL